MLEGFFFSCAELNKNNNMNNDVLQNNVYSLTGFKFEMSNQDTHYV